VSIRSVLKRDFSRDVENARDARDVENARDARDVENAVPYNLALPRVL